MSYSNSLTSVYANNNVTNPIPGLDQKQIQYWVLKLDWSPIQSQFRGQLGLGGAIQSQYLVLGLFLLQLVTHWIKPKHEAHGPQLLGVGLGLQCDPNPNLIPWDWISREIQSLIFQYWVLKKRSNPINWLILYWIGLVSLLIPSTGKYYIYWFDNEWNWKKSPKISKEHINIDVNFKESKTTCLKTDEPEILRKENWGHLMAIEMQLFGYYLSFYSHLLQL
jgi:hypothetical protein